MTAPLIKQRALTYLVEERRQTSRPPYTVRTNVTASRMASILGVPLHDLVHSLWDLQKQDAVRFRERKYGRGSIGRGDLDQFQVTRKGLEMAEGDPLPTPPKPVEGKPVNVSAFVANVTRQPEPVTAVYIPPIPPELVDLQARWGQRLELERISTYLEGLGMEDIALTIMERMPVITPAEKAALDYIQRLHEGPPLRVDGKINGVSSESRA